MTQPDGLCFLVAAVFVFGFVVVVAAVAVAVISVVAIVSRGCDGGSAGGAEGSAFGEILVAGRADARLSCVFKRGPAGGAEFGVLHRFSAAGAVYGVCAAGYDAEGHYENQEQ